MHASQSAGARLAPTSRAKTFSPQEALLVLLYPDPAPSRHASLGKPHCPTCQGQSLPGRPTQASSASTAAWQTEPHQLLQRKLGLLLEAWVYGEVPAADWCGSPGLSSHLLVPSSFQSPGCSGQLGDESLDGTFQLISPFCVSDINKIQML